MTITVPILGPIPMPLQVPVPIPMLVPSPLPGPIPVPAPIPVLIPISIRSRRANCQREISQDELVALNLAGRICTARMLQDELVRLECRRMHWYR